MSQLESLAHEHVDVELNYLRNTGVRPVAYAIAPPEGVPRYTGEVEPRPVRIFNGRRLDATTLDREGFALHAHRSELSDFSDERLIREVYYREVEQLLKRVTGERGGDLRPHAQTRHVRPQRRGPS